MAANAKPRKSRINGTWDSMSQRRRGLNAGLSSRKVDHRSIMWTSRLQFCIT